MKRREFIKFLCIVPAALWLSKFRISHPDVLLDKRLDYDALLSDALDRYREKLIETIFRPHPLFDVIGEARH